MTNEMFLFILVIILSVTLIALVVGRILYVGFEIGKPFFHDVLKWHMPTYDRSFDGYSMHSYCKYCGKEIMQDSHGNWFAHCEW